VPQWHDTSAVLFAKELLEKNLNVH